MEIKQAKIQDLEMIMNMYASCVRGMIKNDIDQWDHTYPNSKVITQDIKHNNYYIYIENNEVIGGIAIDNNQSPEYLEINWEDKTNQFLCVHRLAVKEDFWDKGIGQKLMKYAVKLVIIKNLKSIRLDTYSGNPHAMNFYKKINYKQLGYIYLKPNKNEYYCFEKII